MRRLGGHASQALGIELAAEGGPERWWVASVLRAACRREETAHAGYRALAGAGLATPAGLAGAAPGAVATALAGAGVPRPERAAAVLERSGAALAGHPAGSLAALAAEADDTPDLGAALTRLAPGVGGATVLRFLRPLRDVWPAAREVPLAPAARAAAIHLGLLREGEDEEGEPGALRAALAGEANAPPLADVEAGLERLGSRACLRNRRDRCPLAAECPARRAPDPSGS